ncbi:hypothetical protein [Aquibium sp. ELW1220]|uniref:hypothetical protein n=1 Tax=Aquibium sp. ELW1220 TaxID=2976766 RepID=UPI0025AF3983|nr:hypothetical protein [Aquibium sp. ELW1220]MDN2579207.1 hypothetical protein [Aquibium sp. ELW1220]
MNESVENLVLEHLRAMRSDISALKNNVAGVRAEMMGIKHHIAAFLGHEIVQDGDIASLKERVERIEKRLDLVD